ncbi:MAG TPA: HAMP domain-containing sensor histidine kinase [Verrucomicrobiae bacterium]|nr:HAMP domain-containing sensor histidine kinase [Verrucomicrobiae bacterium]
MRFTLFSRLVFGYLAIFVLMAAVGLYAVYQLRRIQEITRSVLERDRRVLDLADKLGDTILSEVRYEKKFFIMKDQALYDQFLLFDKDFERLLDDADAVSDVRGKALLQNIREGHQRYAKAAADEFATLKTRQPYSDKSYREEKEAAVDAIIGDLDKLRARGQQRSEGKLTGLAAAGADAHRIAVFIAAAALILVLVISLVITRSVTRPLTILKERTSLIARGEFEGKVELSSPPEIADLAHAFNLMCDRLKDLDEMKSDFYSTMSHELRTPLTSIKEGIGLLLEGVGGAVSDKQRRLLTILAEESQRLISLVNSLLDLSKMEAGMMTYHLEPASLVSVIDRAVTELGPLAEAKKIKIEAQIQQPLPLVKMDPDRILQALRNLIGNAVKFTPDGGHVMLSAAQKNGSVEVAVSDTGPGISTDDLPMIFDKYRQGNAKSSYMLRGTGLGLAIVKHIITSHGGQVWVESEAGQGSSFIFVLPK